MRVTLDLINKQDDSNKVRVVLLGSIEFVRAWKKRILQGWKEA